MYSSERLTAYYPFDSRVVEQIVDVAYRQLGQSWNDIQRGLPEKQTYIGPDQTKPIEVIDIVPWDYDRTYVYHLPLNNALDPNMSMRIATLASAAPDKRIIAVGNPSAPGRSIGKIALKDVSEVWSGNLRATVDPILCYLSSQNIETATHIGFSYGAEKAVAAGLYADWYDQDIDHSIFMEPITIKRRNLISLFKAIAQTTKLDDYICATENVAYKQARRLAIKEGHGKIGFDLGLLRLTNLAIEHALTKDLFELKARAGLLKQRSMKTAIIWGSDSKVSIDSLMRGVSASLQQTFRNRVQTMPLEGQTHAMGEDIYLHAAIVIQSDR